MYGSVEQALWEGKRLKMAAKEANQVVTTVS